MPECCAVIPARGGSKGVPRKNLRTIAGKPLIAHTIAAARRSRHLDRIIVSSEDPEIRAVAEEYGVETVVRPAALSDDHASSESALLHVLGHLRNTESYQPDILVFLQCTSPLTVASDIDGIVEKLLDDDADTALSVCKFYHFLWDYDERGNACGINHDKAVRKHRQERSSHFLETGAVYAMRVPGFLRAKHRFFGRTTLFTVPSGRSIEIDHPIDFQIAEALLLAPGG